jgi:hypothetical protein
MKLLDTTGHYTGSQSYGRTSTHEVDGRVVRIEVYIDGYAAQSFARAKVLSKLDTWEPLTSLPSSEWYATAPSYANRNSDVAATFTTELEARLLVKAQRITVELKRLGDRVFA